MSFVKVLEVEEDNATSINCAHKSVLHAKGSWELDSGKDWLRGARLPGELGSLRDPGPGRRLLGEILEEMLGRET